MRGFTSSVAAAAVLAALAASPPAGGVPGPDSVAVVANGNVPESVALAEAYAVARQVPARQVCLLDLPATVDITLDEFRSRLAEPLEACLADAGVLDGIEAVLLVRGTPLRVAIPLVDGDQRVSLAAALGVWKSVMKSDGSPLLGQAPGMVTTCGGGSPCYTATWSSPFRTGPFGPGWSYDGIRVEWHPLLVTMLHGRSYEDAARLIASAVDGDHAGGAPGRFMFMDGADEARGALDTTYDPAMAALRDRGFSDVVRVPFDSNDGGHDLAAFFTGTASLGSTIEGNTFAPGSIVDNLTSFGAGPVNFEAAGESQVSIARWVAMGVAGVHGTTDEPLNNVFPNRRLIVEYVDGSTLAETFHRRLPYVYWRNLVLGDPMAAPYAGRPEVTIGGVSDGETVAGDRRLVVTAEDPEGRGIASVRLLVDGVEAAFAEGGVVDECVDLPEGGAVQVLAVAQAADDGSDRGRHQPKGWTELHVTGVPGPSGCGASADADADGDGDAGGDGEDGEDAVEDGGETADDGDAAQPEGDAAPGDGGADAPGPPGDDGCACSAPGAPPVGRFAVSAIVLATLAAGLRRRPRGRP